MVNGCRRIDRNIDRCLIKNERVILPSFAFDEDDILEDISSSDTDAYDIKSCNCDILIFLHW